MNNRTCLADTIIASIDSTVARWSESSLLPLIVAEILALVHRILLHVGFSDDEQQHLPSSRTLIYYSTSFLLIALLTFIYRNQSEERRRRRLLARQQLQQNAQNQQLSYLQKELRLSSSSSSSSSSLSLSSSPSSSRRPKGGAKNNNNNNNNKQQQQQEEEEVRIFMDGAFDLLHYGHMNAFRLGRSLGTHLIVGLNSDESITKCKGSAPLMNDNERLTMVAACKFVDEVVADCPYIMNKQYLDFVIEKYRIDFVIHGDDPCIVDGKDVYATAKAAGKYRQIPRTEGVSTTDIVGRMLVMTKEHHYQEVILSDNDNDIDAHDGINSNDDDDGSATSEAIKASDESISQQQQQKGGPGQQQQQQQSKFVNTSRMLQLFSSGLKAATASMKIVYIDGAWDLFHPGHVAILKAAREMGDYLIVGIHGDAVVNQIRGMNLPLMNLHERVLSVLGCRHVDDVVIDAPYVITADFMDSHNISLVVRAGRHEDDFGSSSVNDASQEARFRHVQSRGILVVMDDNNDTNNNPRTSFCLGNIVSRIKRNQEMFQAKFERKISVEREFYKEKQSRQQPLQQENSN